MRCSTAQSRSLQEHFKGFHLISGKQNIPYRLKLCILNFSCTRTHWRQQSLCRASVQPLWCACLNCVNHFSYAITWKNNNWQVVSHTHVSKGRGHSPRSTSGKHGSVTPYMTWQSGSKHATRERQRRSTGAMCGGFLCQWLLIIPCWLHNACQTWCELASSHCLRNMQSFARDSTPYLLKTRWHNFTCCVTLGKVFPTQQGSLHDSCPLIWLFHKFNLKFCQQRVTFIFVN